MRFCLLKLLKLKVNMKRKWLATDSYIKEQSLNWLYTSRWGQIENWEDDWLESLVLLIFTWLFGSTFLAFLATVNGKKYKHVQETDKYVIVWARGNKQMPLPTPNMLLFILLSIEWRKCAFVFVTYIFRIKPFIHSKQDYQGCNKEEQWRIVNLWAKRAHLKFCKTLI